MRDAVRKWMQNLTAPAGKRFVGIDFDSCQLRIVQGERVTRRTRIGRLLALEIPGEVDTADPVSIGEFIGRTLKERRIPRAGVVMSVPRGLAVLKPLALPPGTPEDEMASMVRFQMAKELPFAVEEAVIDYTVERHFDAETDTADDSQGLSVLVAAVRLPAVDYYRHLARAAGVKLQRLGLRPHANQGCVNRCTVVRGDEQVAVVHVTHDEAEIDVLAGPSLAFSRATMGKVPPPGQASSAERDAAVGAIVVEAARSIQSYQAVERRGAVDRIVVAGGTGIENELAEQLGRRLGKPAELLNPAAAFDLEGDGSAAEFITALGLAIRHSGGGGLPFDFLHPKEPVVRRDPRRLRRVAAAVAAVAVVLFGGLTIRNYLSGLADEVSDLREQERKAEDTAKIAKRISSRVTHLKRWAALTPSWLDHWMRVSALLPPAEKAYVAHTPGMRFSVDPPSGRETSTEATGRIRFTLHARDSETLASLLERLRSAGYSPQPSRLQRSDDQAGYTYVQEVTVQFDASQPPALAEASVPPRPEDDSPNWPEAVRTLKERARKRRR